MGSHYQVVEKRKLLVGGIPGFSMCLDVSAHRQTCADPPAARSWNPSINQAIPVASHCRMYTENCALCGSLPCVCVRVCVCVFLQIADAPFSFSAQNVSIYAASHSPSAVLGPSHNSFLAALEADCLFWSHSQTFQIKFLVASSLSLLNPHDLESTPPNLWEHSLSVSVLSVAPARTPHQYL